MVTMVYCFSADTVISHKDYDFFVFIADSFIPDICFKSVNSVTKILLVFSIISLLELVFFSGQFIPVPVVTVGIKSTRLCKCQ